MLVSAVLIFTRLGTYSLWDDEASTALAAKGVLRTGDTSALVDDHNIFAYRSGAELEHLRVRYLPPLQAYLAAPFIAVMGDRSALPPRIPFAICGVLAVLALMVWLLRSHATTMTTVLFAAALVGNVSLILYARQARYYAPALLCSIAIGYAYVNWSGRRSQIATIIAASLGLLALTYLNYVALYACLAVDCIAWGRKSRPMAVKHLIWMLAPQVVVAVALVSVWNPLARHVVDSGHGSWLADRLTLLWWNLRDLNAAEFGIAPLLLLVPFVAYRFRDSRLARACVALAVYIVAIAVVSPQPVADTGWADVRYLVPLIPLCIALEVVVISRVAGTRRWLAAGLAVLAFGTNLLNGGPLLARGAHSELVSFAGELMRPPHEPYGVATQWLNAHVERGASVWVLPEYMTYPLMYHAPDPTYAWQLDAHEADPQFANLPDIDFRGRVPPDYIVAFGPIVNQLRPMLAGWNEATYDEVAMLDCFWRDSYRPELFWRTFTPITQFDRSREAIYVFRRREVAPPDANHPKSPKD